MLKETEYIKNLLPSHYHCEPRVNGVHCHSTTGISDDEHWELIILAIKKRYGDRFQEIFHQTCSNHYTFTVYIKPL